MNTEIGADFWQRFDSINNESISDLCKTLDISYKVIAQQRFDRRVPRLPELIKICEHFNASLDFLIFGKAQSQKEMLPYQDIIDKVQTLDTENLAVLRFLLKKF